MRKIRQKGCRMINLVKNEIRKTLVGKDNAIESIMIAMLSGGHVLIEDLPGLGKTTLAKAFAASLDCTYRRIQFTPDLMPSDLIGISIFSKEQQKFVFHEGPIFTNVLLADEINRTSPKTQSSLLEAMEESQVTVDGRTLKLEAPFIVIATENPIELQGTFPLPEAQLDRFMMRISLGYPTTDEEVEILTLKENPALINGVITKDALADAIRDMEKIYVDPALKRYIVKLMKATREHPSVKLGASPRASVHLFNGARAKAYLYGRDFVIASDISSLFETVIGHRLILKGEALHKGTGLRNLLQEIVDTVEVPKVSR
ncbi:MoxR family ATPase [Fusibacter bizertensis]|uniref:MoxR family ATPase n=1 Tax=Fusibacter bizertensis TaxID=1488331 RepID=A0ABT6NFQ4_9FIRM|nr:MoxR family ATPase [Fusibacter bizertensis]MDH8679217.1 MoxR family ATPase [Fusibacter bizertensis]